MIPGVSDVVADNIPCKMLKTQYDMAMTNLLKAIRKPLKLLNAAQGLLNSARGFGLDLIDGILGVVKLPGSSDLSAIANALRRLKDCAAYANNTALLGTFQSTIDIIDGGGELSDLPEDFLDFQKDMLRGAAGGVVTGLLGGLGINKLMSAESMYRLMLNEAGVPAMLATLDGIANCLAYACEGFEKAVLAIDDLRSSLSIDDDDHISIVSDKVSEAVKQEYEAAKDRYAEVVDLIENETFLDQVGKAADEAFEW